MKSSSLLSRCGQATPISTFIFAAMVVFSLSQPVRAGESTKIKELINQSVTQAPSEQPLQTELTDTDLKILTKLIRQAQDNSPAVREARYNRGPINFEYAILPELIRDQENGGFNFGLTINPLYLIAGVQKQSTLKAQVRDAMSQVRVAVVQNYVAYVRAHQATNIAAQKLQKVIASISQTQVASLQPQSGHLPQTILLADNPEYVASANEMLAANCDEMIALEVLAASVGMPPDKTMEVIREEIALDKKNLQEKSFATKK